MNMEETTERCVRNARVPSYTLDQIFKWVAWRLPRRLIYWCAIRLMVNGGVDESPHALAEVSCIDALTRWNIKKVTIKADPD